VFDLLFFAIVFIIFYFILCCFSLCFLVLLFSVSFGGLYVFCIVILRCHFVSNRRELLSFLIIFFLPLSMVGACFVSFRSWVRFGLIVFFVVHFWLSCGCSLVVIIFLVCRFWAGFSVPQSLNHPFIVWPMSCSWVSRICFWLPFSFVMLVLLGFC
jgi:hypothetical protein